MKPAPRIILWLLRRLNKWAVTLPWGTIYCVPEQLDNPKLLKHEQVHLEQIKRDGAVKWTVKILYQYARYGYSGSEYEIEARNISGL